MNYLEEIKARIETLVGAAEQLNAEKELLEDLTTQQRGTIKELCKQLDNAKRKIDDQETLLREGKAKLVKAVVVCSLLIVVILAMGFSTV